METCRHPSPASPPIARNRHPIVTLLQCYIVTCYVKEIPTSHFCCLGLCQIIKTIIKTSKQTIIKTIIQNIKTTIIKTIIIKTIKTNDHHQKHQKQNIKKENKTMSLILSEHFRLAEFTTSLVAVTRRIDNTPPLPAICNLQQLCLHVLEPLRAHLGHAVRINSGYRSAKLNAAVGGVKTSDHTRGCAADIFVPDVKTGREWFAWMMDNLPFDQLIWETASAGKAQWIHVGYRGAGRNRQQVIGHLVKR